MKAANHAKETKPVRNVRMLLDEAALLGKLEPIKEAVGIGRSYGVRLEFYFQSLGQVEESFPEGQAQTLLGNATQVFFGVNDNKTADYVSARIGEQTVVLDSGGASHGSTWQRTGGGQPSQSHGGSYTASSNWSLSARKVLKPEEVISLHPRLALTFTPGLPPVLTFLLRHFEEVDLTRLARGRGRRRGALVELAKMLYVLAFLVAASGICTRSLLYPPRMPPYGLPGPSSHERKLPFPDSDPAPSVPEATQAE